MFTLKVQQNMFSIPLKQHSYENRQNAYICTHLMQHLNSIHTVRCIYQRKSPRYKHLNWVNSYFI